MNLFLKIKIYVIVAIAAFGVGMVSADYIRPPVIKEIEIVKVEKVVERVRTVTKIKESPDGTKETIITAESETKSDRKDSYIDITRPAVKKWIVGTLWEINREDSRWGIHVQRHQILGFYLGAYATVHDGFEKPAAGLSLSYSF